MQGRYFDGRQIEASLYSGRQRFKRSGAHGDTYNFDLDADAEGEGGGEEAEKKRLDEFAKWLMSEGD